MKRLKPAERKQIVRDTVDKYWYSWTCRQGAWNRDRLCLELAKALKEKVHAEGKELDQG